MNFLWNIIIWKQYQFSKLIFQHSIVKCENLTTNRASHSFSAALTPSDIFSWHPSLCSRPCYFLEHEQVIAAHCFPGKPGWQGSLLCPLLSIVLQSPRAGLAGCPCRGTLTCQAGRAPICSLPASAAVLPTPWEGSKRLWSHVYLVRLPWKT